MKTPEKLITVLLVDDHTVVREGFRMVLALEKDIQVLAEARSGREAVKLARELKPDVIVMDIAMPLMNGFEAARQILSENPAARILVLSAHTDDEYIDRIMATGAVGYVGKQSSSETLSKAVREVMTGHVYLDAALAGRLGAKNRKFLGRTGVSMKKNRVLSSREAEVLQLVAEGKANKETADELGISIKTVEKHRQHVMEKLDIHDTAGLTRHAISTGIIENSTQPTVRGSAKAPSRRKEKASSRA